MDSSIPDEKNVENNFETEKEEDALQKAQKHKEIIDILPKEEQEGSSRSYHQYQGFWYSPQYIEKILSLQEHFKADPTDIVICSFPKTGTTWLKSLSFAIVTRKLYDESSNPLLKAVSHECVPFMEIDFITSSSSRDPKLPLVATHLPYISLPESVVTKNCKIVYICRDPNDLIVSMWHFVNKISFKTFQVQPTSFQSMVDNFCGGRTFCGPYWDHVLEYWKASQERPENVLFLKYEDMKEDTLLYIRKMAEFFDQPFSQEEEMEGVPQKIMNMCSFENLSNLEANKTGKHREGTQFEMNNNVYFRKGEVGDWKNHLTQEMKEQIDLIMAEKLHGSGLTLSRP